MTAEPAPIAVARRADVRRLAGAWHYAALGGILALSALLDFLHLSQNGYANTYYSAAVRSMLGSWHNFFFVSFDPGGLVSVDKPPLALWLQAASAKAFGYSGFSILLPEALAGVLAVWVLYLLVARWMGRVAGLVAALALAVSPVSVAVNRDNNPDALLALLLVLALYVGARAIGSGRLRTLLLTAVVVGLAFNTKMLAAMVVVPGLAAGYLFFAPGSWKRRIVQLLAAGAVLVAASGAWIAAVDLTPAADRPYVGSTTSNSAFSLAFDYNGLGRVTGQTGGTSTGGGGLGGAFSGTPGWLRLFNDVLGDQAAWILPLAVVGGISLLVALALAWRRRRRELGIFVAVAGWFASAAVVFSFSSGIIHTYYLSALAPATCALVGAGTVALWNDARRGRFWVAFPLVALVLCAWLQVDLLRRTDYLSWLPTLVVAGLLGAATVLVMLAIPGFWPESARRGAAAAAVALGVGTLLVAPAAWSATTWKGAVNGVFPGAGPNFVTGLTASSGRGFAAGPGGPGPGGGGFVPGGGFGNAPTGGFGPPTGGVGGAAPPTGGFAGAGPGGFGGGSTGIAAALRYVKAHGAASRFGLIVQNEQEAAAYVIKGEPVASMGGFTGRETVLTNAYLARLVRDGEARYFLLGQTGFGAFRGGPGGTSNAAVSTIESACTAVPSSAWAGSSTGTSGTLYDCAGKADAIASAAA